MQKKAVDTGAKEKAAQLIESNFPDRFLSLDEIRKTYMNGGTFAHLFPVASDVFFTFGREFISHSVDLSRKTDEEITCLVTNWFVENFSSEHGFSEIRSKYFEFIAENCVLQIAEQLYNCAE